MRVQLLVGVLMMDAMRSDPEKRSAFERQRGAEGEEIFHPLVGFVSAVSQQPVVRHADSEATRNPQQYDRQEQGLPAEHEQGSYGADVECQHEKKCNGIQRLTKRPVISEAHGAGFSLVRLSIFLICDR